MKCRHCGEVLVCKACGEQQSKPAKTPGRKKYTIFLDEEQLAEIDEKAKAQGISRAEYIRKNLPGAEGEK
jgi:predicted HicB family RNase H-like nuclease